MRTASRRARRLGGLLLVAATVLWAFMRRRANAVRWVEPPATTQPVGGARLGTVPAEVVPAEVVPAEVVPDEVVPDEVVPDDVLATDAGLTELPADAEGSADAVDELPADTVDEARVAEILAESPDADVVVVDEASYEQAVADAAPEPPADTPAAEAEEEAVATGPATAEPTEESTEAGLEAGVPSGAAAEESTEAGLAAGVPSGAAADDEPTERELPGPRVDEATVMIRSEGAGEPDRGVPMPNFSEAPTAEIPAVTDELRAIRGIGPSMERKLQDIGIVSYRQLALLDGAELERVRGELTDFRGRIEREDWVGQARALYREKYGRDPS